MRGIYLPLLFLTAFFFCLFAGIPSSAIADNPPIVPRTAVAISGVQVDTVVKKISIKGLDLDHIDSDNLIVSLGDFGELSIYSVSPDGGIVVDFPPEGLPDGDYLLTVSSRNGKRDRRHYDKRGKKHFRTIAFYQLTVGAVGPQGPQGETGPAGLQGEAGAQGETGLVGVQGPQGIAGPTGSQGIQGPQGPLGPPDPAVAELLARTMDELCRFIYTDRAKRSTRLLQHRTAILC